MAPDYDMIIIGAGVSGAAMASAMSSRLRCAKRTPNILLIERSLAPPTRIAGEVLQPGGVRALHSMGLKSILENLDTVPLEGYCVIHNAKNVHLSYSGHTGAVFDHGSFVTALRDNALRSPGVKVLEATVESMVECTTTGRILGVEVRLAGEKSAQVFTSHLTVVADGSSSHFRRLMGKHQRTIVRKGCFAALLLQDISLPFEHHGTLVTIPRGGPVLLYRMTENSVRMLVDISEEFGKKNMKDIKSYVLTSVIPAIPRDMHPAVINSLENDRILIMPNLVMPASVQGSSKIAEGVIFLGDSWNMRHPLTGGGMTVALNDVNILSNLLVQSADLSDWRSISRALRIWYIRRKPLSSTLNIMSVALYHLFASQGPAADILRSGCFGYFEIGGFIAGELLALIGGHSPNPLSLLFHFLVIPWYGSALLVKDSLSSMSSQKVSWASSLFLFRTLWYGVQAVWLAWVIFWPPLYNEIKWW